MFCGVRLRSYSIIIIHFNNMHILSACAHNVSLYSTELVTFHSAESAHMSIQFAHARNVSVYHRKIVRCTSQASGKLEASGAIKKVPHSDCAAPIVPVPKVVTIRSQSIKNWMLINTRSQNPCDVVWSQEIFQT